MFLFSIIFSLIVGISEIDLIVPSFPEMQKVFGLSPSIVELTLSLNLIAHCIAALFAGNLGDRYGHKRVILYGFSLFIFGSLLGALAYNFHILLIGRILQGIGVAPAIVLSYLIAMEKYPPSDHGQIMGLLNGVVAISLSAAPVLGSYVSLHYGYKGNFALMAMSGVLGGVILLIFIPRSNVTREKVRLHINEYLPVLKNKASMQYILLSALLMATYYTFVGTASLLFVEGLGLSLSDFGMYMSIATLTFGLFSIFSGKIFKLAGKRNTLFASMLLLCHFLVAAFLLAINSVNTPALILSTNMLFIVGMIAPLNEGFALALKNAPEAQGKVSALISTFKWLFTVIGVQTASYFYHGSYFPIGITLISMISLCVLLIIFVYRQDSKLKITLNSV